MDHYQALANRDLAVSLLLNSSASDALAVSRLGQQHRSSFSGSPSSHSSSNLTALRIQRELIDREISRRTALAAAAEKDTLSFLRSSSLGSAHQYPSATRLLPSLSLGLGGRQTSPGLKPSPPGADPHALSVAAAVSMLKRTHSDSASVSSASTATSSSEQQQQQQPANKKQRLNSGKSSSKGIRRDDFWGKVGKVGSHIHLVNVILGRLLNNIVKSSKGNKVLSNDTIQSVMDTKLYGKYKVCDYFASANKASETVRNSWTRLNFASDDIRKGLSRYKEQTWQAIERCDFDNVSPEDKKEMDDALKCFMQTGRFVPALEVALKGIITEEFMGVLMQLRMEWNSLCLKARPEEHDKVVAGFLRCYGLNGK